MKFVRVQAVPRDGLGFPVVPLIIGAGSVVGSLFKKKKPKVTEQQAKSAVQQIYLELLERDPWNPYDAGAEGFVNCLIEGWCDVDFIRTEVLQSPERRDVELRRAARTYGGAATSTSGGFVPAGGVVASGEFVPAPAGGIPSTVAGIPIVYLIGGVALLMLMRK